MPSNASQQTNFSFSPAIQTALQEVCASEGATLLETLVRGSNERRIVELYVDKPEGITLDECGSLSERIGELLDAEKVFPAAYRLEVSSPGVSRPLQFSWQYARNVGRLLHVERRSNDAVKGRIAAILSDAERGDVLVLDAPKARTSKTAAKKAAASGEAGTVFPIEIPLAEIARATVEIEF
jgi:ribosome maturation factor RimP